MRRHYSTSQAARLLGYSPQTLRNWRHLGIGPKYIPLNACRVVYDSAELLRWLEERKLAESV
jgi:hypothetical protein